MAASGSTVGGYDCELFLSPVPEELKCGSCKQVAREPNLTSCCGEHFCKLCIKLVVGDKKPCPSCEEAEVSILGTDKRDHRKILALEVRCSMKDRGCDWTGALEQLDAHLDVDSDNCQYVDVKCPNKCEQPVQKHHLPTHLANECTKRDFFCQYCNFTATYEVVCNDHWPQCPFYPVPCPNGCEIMAIERGDLDAHLMLCSLEVVECDFSYAGCNVKLVREELERHLADNLQRHVLMMNKALQEKIEEKERKIEQLEARLEEKDRQIQEQIREREQLRQEKDKQIQELREENDRKIQEHVREQEQQTWELRKERDRQVQDLQEKEDRQIKELRKTVKEEQVKQIQETQAKVEAQLEAMFMTTRCGVPQFTMNGFQERKCRGKDWDSPLLYTHPGGYRIGFRVFPIGYGGGKGTHVTVYIRTTGGGNDAQLKWPADCTITLQLLNQHRDQDHVIVSQRFQWAKPSPYVGGIHTFSNYRFIAQEDLDLNAEKQTQYLKNDSLQFRITDIQVHSI